MFFWINNNVETLISFSGSECTDPINMNSNRAFRIGIDSDISFNNDNMESNLNKVYIKHLI